MKVDPENVLTPTDYYKLDQLTGHAGITDLAIDQAFKTARRGNKSFVGIGSVKRELEFVGPSQQ